MVESTALEMRHMGNRIGGVESHPLRHSGSWPQGFPVICWKKSIQEAVAAVLQGHDPGTYSSESSVVITTPPPNSF